MKRFQLEGASGYAGRKLDSAKVTLRVATKVNDLLGRLGFTEIKRTALLDNTEFENNRDGFSTNPADAQRSYAHRTAYNLNLFTQFLSSANWPTEVLLENDYVKRAQVIIDILKEDPPYG